MNTTTRFIPVSVLKDLGFTMQETRGHWPCGECDECQIDMQGCTNRHEGPLTGVQLFQGENNLGCFYADTDSRDREIVLFDEAHEKVLYDSLRSQYRQVIWIGDAITKEQCVSLKHTIVCSYLSPLSPEKPKVIDIVNVTTIFPAIGKIGVDTLTILAQQLGADTVAGNIPVHTAVAVCKARNNGKVTFTGLIPVGVNTPTGIEHSHFEWL